MKQVLLFFCIALVSCVLAAMQPARADDTAALANAIAAEQVLVIMTDDRYYIAYPRDGMKIDPLTGLPFARSEREEFAAAVGMNFMLRNPHHEKLLHITATAFPVMERSILGVGLRFWKTWR
jgi:hypothetical protein